MQRKGKFCWGGRAGWRRCHCSKVVVLVVMMISSSSSSFVVAAHHYRTQHSDLMMEWGCGRTLHNTGKATQTKQQVQQEV